MKRHLQGLSVNDRTVKTGTGALLLSSGPSWDGHASPRGDAQSPFWKSEMGLEAHTVFVQSRYGNR